MILTAAERLAWENARIAEHRTDGATQDEAMKLMILDWCAMTGEDPEDV